MNLQTNAWVTPVRDGLRIGQTAAPGAAKVGGMARVRALEDVARHATGLRVYAAGSGATAWELETKAARFLLVLSPETWRGFTGEGQALEKLAGAEGRSALGRAGAPRCVGSPCWMLRHSPPQTTFPAATWITRWRGWARLDWWATIWRRALTSTASCRSIWKRSSPCSPAC